MCLFNKFLTIRRFEDEVNVVFGMAVIPFLCRGLRFSPKLLYHRIISFAVSVRERERFKMYFQRKEKSYININFAISRQNNKKCAQQI